MTLFSENAKMLFCIFQDGVFWLSGGYFFDESMDLLLQWSNANRPCRKGVVAGVKSVGADKNIREVKIECKAVFINYTGGLYEYF